LRIIPSNAKAPLVVRRSGMMMMFAGRRTPGTITTSRPLQTSQGAPQGFDFLFIRGLLAFGEFKHLEHFVHLVQSITKRLDNLVHLPDSFLDRFGRGWPPRLTRWTLVPALPFPLMGNVSWPDRLLFDFFAERLRGLVCSFNPLKRLRLIVVTFGHPVLRLALTAGFLGRG
jgi:hypothetical protein